MKKKHTRVIVLLVAAAALLLLYLLFRCLPGWLDGGDEPAETGSGETTTYTVTDRVYTDIRTLTYTADGETFRFSRDGESGKWTYLDDVAFPLLADPLDRIASYISSLTSERRIDGGDTGVYGFSKPTLTVQATYADGTALTLTEGSYNTFAGQYYLLADGEVYLVSPMLRQCFDVSLSDMIALDTLPAGLTERSIRSMLLRSADGREKRIDDENGVLLVMDVSTYVFPLTSWIKPHATAEELAELGITAESMSLTVTYEAEVSPSPEIAPEKQLLSFTYRFGRTAAAETETGEPGDEVVCFTIGDSTIVYVMQASLLDDLWAFFDYEAPAEPSFDTE